MGNVLIERRHPVAEVTINRPQVLNALDAATIAELGQTFNDLRTDEDLRAVIVTGAGDKAFVAGADIRELADLGPAAAVEYARLGQRLCNDIENLGKPVIAAVNGFALGGGCELALSCTFRLASEIASFGQPEINLGIIPGFGGTQRLPRLIGRGVALDLLLSGRRINAAEALACGLVSRVTPPASLMDEARALAMLLAAKPPVAVRAILQAVHHGMDLPLQHAVSLEAESFGVVTSTEDKREGTTAFLQKRQPQFRGR